MKVNFILIINKKKYQNWTQNFKNEVLFYLKRRFIGKDEKISKKKRKGLK